LKVLAKNYYIFWKVFPIFLCAIFISPILIILSSLLGNFSENWVHLYNYVLFEYFSNTLILVLGVGSLSLIIGSLTAWIVTTYNFFGKRIFEWSLILPLSIPPYILAYTFTGLFDSYGTVNNLLRDILNLSSSYIFFPNVRNIYGAIIVFSFTLYPYVYLICRSAFLNQSKAMLETGRVLGLNKLQIFSRLALPMIRPAAIAGVMLVVMETVSDFGAVEHFAVQTFTTGIFRTWYGMYDLHTAMQLASLLLVFVLTFVFIERNSRKNATYASMASRSDPDKPELKTGIASFFCFLACLIPIFIGFILPIMELSIWALNYNLSFFNENFLVQTLNTLYVSLIAAFLCTLFALLVNFSARFNESKFIARTDTFLSLGYAVPGLILAIGIVQIFTILDSTILKNSQFFITGSLIGLIFAYIVKSYALSSSTIESGFERINLKLDDSARVLKSSGINLMLRVHYPLLKTSLLTSLLLVMAEAVKELPATLVLRPFNFDTLAVSTYIYAAEERMYEAASPAIAIVLIGLIPILILTQMIRKSRYTNH